MRGVRVVVLALESSQSLDVVGPVEVFDAATQLAGAGQGYEISVVSPGGGPLLLSNGLTLGTSALPGPRVAIDTIVVAGGSGARYVGPDDPAVEWLRRAAPRARRV